MRLLKPSNNHLSPYLAMELPTTRLTRAPLGTGEQRPPQRHNSRHLCRHDKEPGGHTETGYANSGGFPAPSEVAPPTDHAAPVILLTYHLSESPSVYIRTDILYNTFAPFV